MRRSSERNGRSRAGCLRAGHAWPCPQACAAAAGSWAVKLLGWSLGLLLELKGDPPCSKPDQIPLNVSLLPSNAPTSPYSILPRSGFVLGWKADFCRTGHQGEQEVRQPVKITVQTVLVPLHCDFDRLQPWQVGGIDQYLDAASDTFLACDE